MAKENNLLSWENSHLTLQSIGSYNTGKLSQLDMHKAERHILNCDLCADALEGYGNKGDNPKLRKNLEALRHQIRKKSERREKSGSAYKIWGIAASIVIIMGVGFYYFQSSFLKKSDEPLVAMKQEQTEEPSTQEQSAVEDAEPDDKEGFASNEGLEVNQNPSISDPSSLQDLSEQAVRTQEPVQASAEPPKLRASEADQNQTLTTGGNLIDQKENIESSSDLDAESELAANDANEFAAQQTDVAPIAEERLEETKKTTIELAKSSASGGGPELATSTRLSSGAKLGGSIMDSDPEPEVGFAEYADYLQNNLIYPEEARLNNITGVVKIGFILKPGSSYSKFRIVEGLGYGCDKEAERLIQEGPNWKPAVRKGLVTKEEVIVEVNF